MSLGPSVEPSPGVVGGGVRAVLSVDVVTAVDVEIETAGNVTAVSSSPVDLANSVAATASTATVDAATTSGRRRTRLPRGAWTEPIMSNELAAFGRRTGGAGSSIGAVAVRSVLSTHSASSGGSPIGTVLPYR